MKVIKFCALRFYNYTYSYDSKGNMTHKNAPTTGAMYYANSAHPNRLTGRAAETGITYQYDNNGNLLTGNNRSYIWTAHNKPSRITKTDTNAFSEFTYDGNNNRAKQVKSNGDTLYYFGKDSELLIKNNGDQIKTTYLYANGKVVSSHIRTQSTINPAGDQFNYLHYDALGTIDLITNASGSIVMQAKYDPFGKKLWSTGDSRLTNRGYTGHEHLDNVELIHMNARLYDPETAQFISPDTYVQSPSNALSHNRYSYVMNNPMKYTDPSGHFWSELWEGVKNIVNGFAPILIAMAMPWAANYMAGWVAGMAGTTMIHVLTAYYATIIGGVAGVVVSALSGSFLVGLSVVIFVSEPRQINYSQFAQDKSV